MNFKEYIKNAKQPENFVPAMLTKECYLDIMEKCFSAYGIEAIEAMIEAKTDGLIDEIQICSRLTCVLSVLISKGRKTKKLPPYEMSK